MGRGDKKTKKGKISIGSYGVSRSRKAIKARLKRITSAKPAAPAAVASEEKPKKRAPRKKEAAGE
jgi:ribosomal small subunit protein bTHX